MTNQALYSLLAYTGALPFAACALLTILGVAAVDGLGPIDEVAASYGLGIISFVAGTHWATYLYGRSNGTGNLLVSSNVIFLIVWFAYLLAATGAAMIVQAGAFLALLFVDYRLLNAGGISAHYFRVRTLATTIAVVSLVATAL